MRAPSVALAVTLAACSSPYLHHGRVLQGLQLPAQMLTDPGLQKPHDLRGDLRGDLVGHWVGHRVADWVGTPLLGTLLIVYLSQRPFA